MPEAAGNRQPSSTAQQTLASNNGYERRQVRTERKGPMRAFSWEATRFGEEIRRARAIIQEVVNKNNTELVELRVRREWLDLSQTLELFALRSHRLSAVYHRLLEDFSGDMNQFMHARGISLDVKKKEIHKHIVEIGSVQYTEGAEELRGLLEKLRSRISTIRESCMSGRKRTRQESIKVVVMQVARIKGITKIIPRTMKRFRRKQVTMLGQTQTEEPTEALQGSTRPPTRTVPKAPKTPAYRKKAVKNLGKIIDLIYSSNVVVKWENFLVKVDAAKAMLDKQNDEGKVISGIDKVANDARILSDSLAVYMKTLQEPANVKGSN